MVSTCVPAAATNWATHDLFNDSQEGEIIVVRQVRVNLAAGIAVNGYFVKNSIGSHTGVENTLWMNQPKMRGQHFYIDKPAQDSNPAYVWDNPLAIPMHLNEFPLAIIPPGWGLYVQASAAGATMSASFVWEVINAHDLEYLEY